MASCGGFCGINISCSGGCGVICTTDCTDCTQWCEPTHVGSLAESPTQGTLLRVNRSSGDLHIKVVEPIDSLATDSPTFSDQDEFKICIHDLPLASVARILSQHFGRTVNPPAEENDERISASHTGTMAELVSKFSLTLD